jgi:hypothetical protein
MDMPRRLRIEFADAIDHVMARGNARQKIVRDDLSNLTRRLEARLRVRQAFAQETNILPGTEYLAATECNTICPTSG